MGVALAEVVARHGTPLYIYSATTVLRRFAQLRAALQSTGCPFRIQYAMKANRFPPLLALVRAEQDLAMDCCSPREVERALAAGFRPEEISVTAGHAVGARPAGFCSAGRSPEPGYALGAASLQSAAGALATGGVCA
jgi:diaminopimelate decarboxylase